MVTKKYSFYIRDISVSRTNKNSFKYQTVIIGKENDCGTFSLTGHDRRLVWSRSGHGWRSRCVYSFVIMEY